MCFLTHLDEAFLYMLKNKWSLCVFLHIFERLENYFTAFLYDHDDDSTKVQVAFVTTLCF